MATYALIPGGGGDPWEWHRLVPELTIRGHDALAVRLPAGEDTAGWSEYADAVIDAIGRSVAVQHRVLAWSKSESVKTRGRASATAFSRRRQHQSFFIPAA
jgi:hypothetical protein